MSTGETDLEPTTQMNCEGINQEIKAKTMVAQLIDWHAMEAKLRDG